MDFDTIENTSYNFTVKVVNSMNEITERFNTEEALANFVLLAQRHKISSLPHGDTVNNFLEELEPEEIEKIRDNMVKRLLKMRCFDEYKYLNKYLKLIFYILSY